MINKISQAIIAISLVVSIASCNSIDQQGESKDYILTDIKKGFIVDSLYKTLEYRYKGNIANTTANIFKQATVYMDIVFTLNNGEQLTDKSIHANDAIFDMSGVESVHIVEMFEPNQKYDLEEFESSSIDPKYAKYPIQSVVVTFRIQLLDEINNATQQVYLKDEDVTEDWKTTTARYR